jgi:glutamine synthetase
MVRQVALFEEDLEVTYMPKPYADQAGNGLHIHQYIADSQGQSIFGNQDTGLTPEAKHYIGGLLTHAYDITALTNPIVNSYKRLVPNHEAPVYCSWGIANRTALVRVPGYEQNIRCEYRAGDTSANIYLLLALLLESGLDGIKNKIEPIEGTSLNVDHLTDDQRREMKIRKLPGSLEEANNAANDSSFLRSVLGDAFIDQFVSVKRKEWNRYITTSDHETSFITAWEMENYFRKA